ncbi:MAG: magnesium transporter CorA family protein, partial [Candidatus Omnitrophica bacterium]|nr:magnesium transporter CorA family protein [Candidatus Omnitrophota bacterium]
MIKILTFRNNVVEILKSTEEVSSVIGKKGTYVWVDIQKPSDTDIRFLEKHFLFHPLAIEDCMSTIQRPKIDRYERYLFVVLHAAHIGTHRNKATAHELDTFVGENYVVTVHTNPIPSVSMTWERCLRNAQIMSRGTGYLFYYLTDALVDNYFPIIEKLDKEIEKCEDSVFKNPDSNVPNKIFFLKENVMILRRNIGPQREITNFIARGGYEPIIPNNLSVYFRDVADLLARISDSLDLYRDTLTTAMDGYMSSTS